MTLDPALVQALTDSVLPQGLAVAARDPRSLPVAIDPAEKAFVAHAVPSRVAEFHAGRAAARAAMLQLGVVQQSIPMGPDRAPLWPKGITGSISHCATACTAVVGHSDMWAGIGVDLEEAVPLERHLISEVCSPSEESWLSQQPVEDRGLMAKLIFSTKEAAYKAQYPLSHVLFGFDGLEVDIDRATSRFTATFTQPQGRFVTGTKLEGNFAHAAGLMVTAVALRQADVAHLTRTQGDEAR